VLERPVKACLLVVGRMMGCTAIQNVLQNVLQKYLQNPPLQNPLNPL
jgi:hypothetical protein